MNGSSASLVTVALAAVTITASAARLEKPDYTSDQLRKTATHVMIGEVKQIWSREESVGDWDYTRYVAEIAVETSDKGEGLRPGQLIYARYWTRRWDGGNAQPADTSGHRGLPKPGERVRVHLARDAYDGFGMTEDHGFNVIGANGFAKP